MSTSVRFLRDPESEPHKTYLAIAYSCRSVGVSLPKEVADYFGVDDAKDAISEQDEPLDVDAESALSEYQTDSSQGYELNIADIPEGVFKIRFVNSW